MMSGCFVLTKTSKITPVQDLFSHIAPMQLDTLLDALRYVTHQVVKDFCLDPSHANWTFWIRTFFDVACSILLSSSLTMA